MDVAAGLLRGGFRERRWRRFGQDVYGVDLAGAISTMILTRPIRIHGGWGELKFGCRKGCVK
jgi:hypothetical protein